MLRRLAALVFAVLLLAGHARADQDDERLPALFERLEAAATNTEARVAEAMIWQIWSESHNEDTNILMRQGLQAMQQQDWPRAIALFTTMVERDPAFAEGWNKRATVYFLSGDLTASVLDIERTLLLEPRHFGALSGLGQIYLALDRKEAALKAFEAALAVDPHLPSVRATVEALKKELAGSPT
jgi:tetratricopeptide (TPR) repeat protein